VTNGRIRWDSRFPFRSAALSLALRPWHSYAFAGIPIREQNQLYLPGY
jgi:hypothetical protein